MAWQDRSYYRDRPAPAWNPLLWLVYGSVPLFTVARIRVRAHASLILFVILVLALGLDAPWTAAQDRVEFVVILFGLVLLHEFGHCFAARALGGSADDILMHPLGGLAFANPPRKPWPTFLTVAAGPAVNAAICVILSTLMWAMWGWVPTNPFHFTPPGRPPEGWFQLWRYMYWINQISWSLLVFNLLPIYPLDGGQMAQTAMWPKLGYYRSMLVSSVIGMVASVLGAMIAIATRDWGLAILAACGFLCCFTLRRQMIAVGPEEYAEDGVDYSAAYEQPTTHHKHRKISRRAIKRARREAEAAMAEQTAIDAILAKVSAHGMGSLSWMEKRTLHKATERRRKGDLEVLDK